MKPMSSSVMPPATIGARISSGTPTSSASGSLSQRPANVRPAPAVPAATSSATGAGTQ